MYKLTYSNSCTATTFKDFDSLAEELSECFSPKIIDKVAQTLEEHHTYHNAFFTVIHYVGYFYEGKSYSSLYTLSQELAKEVDEEAKVEWFIQNVGVCARKDNGDEIYLPWHDMIYDDYDSKAYDGTLADEVDEAVADVIKEALIKCKDMAIDNKFVLSFWESDFTIEIEEET